MCNTSSLGFTSTLSSEQNGLSNFITSSEATKSPLQQYKFIRIGLLYYVMQETTINQTKPLQVTDKLHHMLYSIK